ncbi:uncharacterized protein LACBIDRAFT_297932 [Laccaria bicolor S238N-H82]|uniref:Predicted protein n=1 Tax=Laccaria bicolor (strain S238N-H82 / ATCC MYA-4686) TaxID=486041 RepID=B0DBU8_LACBS|nr:uncharacterized protein LACBIDRAFT_297932 [Laccaria bicolor S238N-H82]EDR07625.1 predicted protein [Laccaria bicolor S238N-H82]|eukprot:XP_001881414.1 predicted protein [Laccaria bicolor S238N-H82]
MLAEGRGERHERHRAKSELTHSAFYGTCLPPCTAPQPQFCMRNLLFKPDKRLHPSRKRALLVNQRELVA